MSILIKHGMKLPKSCWDCEFEVPTIDHHEACILTGKSYNWGLPHRPSECPLAEVPDPDEDKAFRRGAEAAWEVARKIMTRGPYDGGFDCMELEEIFDYPDVSKDIGSILEKFDAITVMYKIADYERKKADATHDIH